jgi:purine nucleoside permease
MTETKVIHAWPTRITLWIILALVAFIAWRTATRPPGRAMVTSGVVLRPKVIVVVYFEVGNDTGDAPGELQFWVERDHLDRSIEVPGMSHPVRANADGSEVAMVVGPGNVCPAVNLMAFGEDPRFDVRQSYWLINGIAGVSPKDAAIGSAVWADWVVNGDLLHSIDPREMPKDWPDGFYALYTTHPDQQPRVPPGSPDDATTWPKTGAHGNPSDSVVRLNPALLAWAYALTRDIKPEEDDAMRALNAQYKNFPATQQPPTVRIGANLATENYWHGALSDNWAHRWVPYMTDGQAKYGSTAMNDAGALAALDALTHQGRADWNRALVLRAISNYDMQGANMTASESANHEKYGSYTAYLPSLNTAYKVGERVAQKLLSNWPQYEQTIPSAAP